MTRRARKLFACIQIFLQLFPVYLIPSFTTHAQERNRPVDETVQKNQDQNGSAVAQAAVQAGTLLSGDNTANALGSAVASAASGEASSAVQSWLNQFGTARVSISTDERFTLQDSELDVLIPLYDQKEHLFFTQLGGRRQDERNVINTGLGYRYFASQWMWGTNVFYDRQISDNQHQRLGVGAELGWDYLKLSANGYYRLSEWMSSTRYRDYDERAANGFDIRAAGYLPAMPQLGANIVFEQYYGDSVGLFGDDEDDRQKDPYAVTFGLNYTPVPLVTFGVNQKLGKSGENDTQLNVLLNWTPGVPFSDQLDPSAVAMRRTLLGSRQELVDRNNNIVLEYRKQDLISLTLPVQLQGAEQSTQSVTAKVKTKYGLDHIEWQSASFLNNGGKIVAANSPEQVVLTLPAWQARGSNDYILSATAWDKKGNASNVSKMKVSVSGIDINSLQSTTRVSPESIPADGSTTAIVTVGLKTVAGENATDLASRLSTTLTSSAISKTKTAGDNAPRSAVIGSFSETSPGGYAATLTAGTTPETLTIQPLIDGTVKLASVKLIEQAVVAIPQLTALDVSATSTTASGSNPITLTAHVTDQHGNALNNVAIDWTADSPEAILSATQTTTDDSGTAEIQVSSRAVITTAITAKVSQGNSLSSPPLSFTADLSTAKIVSLETEKQQVIANNNDTSTVSAQVMDSYNHPLQGVNVSWTVENADNAKVADKTTQTDSLGVATLDLKSVKTGTITVSAQVNGSEAQETDPISFVADSSTQKISQISVSKPQAVANGSDSIQYEATVTDAQGNALGNIPVNWTTDSSTATLSDTQTTSDGSGKAHITLTSLTSGSVVVSAKTADSTAYQADKATFIADVATAKVDAVASDKQTATANGTDAIALQAKVTDANNNLVGDAEVSWAVTPTTGTLSEKSSKTASNGMAQITLTSDAVAIYSVTASVNGSRQNLSGLSFTADSTTAKLASLAADMTTGIVADKDPVTLTAQVVDAQQHPVEGVTVSWSSSEARSSFAASTSLTDASGKAIATFSSLKAGTITVTAMTGTSSKTQTLAVVGNTDTAKISNIKVNNTQAVADGASPLMWTATAADANGNLLSNVSVNWSASLDGVSLMPASSLTNANGEASTSGTSVKAGKVTVTASPVQNSAEKLTGGEALFIADAKTARLVSITPNSTRVAINGAGVTYTALANDANGNPVQGEKVTWETDINTLSASESVTDASGKASITVKGPTRGRATIKATLNGTMLTDSSVTFTDVVLYDWDITGSTAKYSGTVIVDYPAVGFLATGEVKGPTSLIWLGNASKTALTVPMKNDAGETVNVIFQGQRNRADCSTVQFEAAQSCKTQKNLPELVYNASDNPSLPAGHYTGHITFNGIEWHNGSPLLAYDITTSLTVK
jgi:adhesin/invasin